MVPDTTRCTGPVIFGEVLFDCFPDRRVLGGAPFNVAWNLQGLGQNPLFVGAAGNDGHGSEVRSIMTAWGMDTTGLQIDPAHPTGTVRVSLEGGEPSYRIVADQAYDHVQAAPALQATQRHADCILYHGSLALRAPDSREALAAIRTRLGRVFMDVNLRSPWWDRDTVREFMARATWVKLNENELAALAIGDTPEAQLRDLLAGFGLEAVILTRGAEGAMIAGADGTWLSLPAPPVAGLADTVGAGDAFSAMTLTGLLNEWDWETILERAAGFAAKVCTLRGATTQDPGFYRT